MHITIFGSGYVGLVTGVCFADMGNHVLCVDIDAEKVAMLQNGEVPIHEIGLHSLLKTNLATGRIKFTTDIKKAVAYGEIQCIAVGTPSDEDGSADLQYVLQVAASIGKHMDGYKLIMDKSTVPVGTADKVKATIQEVLDKRGVQHEFDVVSNPEFLKEGAAIADFMKPDRIIIGTDKQRSADLMRELYAPFNRNRDRLMVMDIRSAELTKYAANSLLATKISFMNEIACIAEQIGADVEQVRLGIGSDPRIGFEFIYPGAGYGGSCFHPDELLFIDRGTGLECISFENLSILMETEEQLKVLSGDINGLRFEDLQQITVRDYEEDLLEITFTLGKKIRVTKDHPIAIYKDGKLTTKLAEKLEENDCIILPFGKFPQQDIEIDLLDEIQNTSFLEKTWLNNLDFVNNELEYIKTNLSIKSPSDAKKNGTVKVKDILNYKRILDEQYSDSVIFTARSRSTTIPYKYKLDNDFARLIGYYLAEGWITADYGRNNVERKRLGLCFGEHETEYINDVKEIFAKLKIHFIERISNGSHSIIVSSNLFAFLFEKVLCCGLNSYTKTIPTQIFLSSSEVKWEFLTGLLRGDGGIVKLNKGKNLNIDYATVSKHLAQLLILLLQSFKIIASLKTGYANKSTVETYFVRINGLEQVIKIGELFGDKWQNYKPIADNYQRNIKPLAYQREKDFAIIKVKSITKQPYSGQVYSIESSNSHLISTGGILIHNCFPKDVKALIHTAKQVNADAQILTAVEEVNQRQQQVLFQKINQHFQGQLQDKRFALWGLAFKPNTDDMREAPSRKLMEALWKHGATVQAYDPKAMSETQRIYGKRSDLIFCDSPEATLENADVLVIVTEWKLFRSPDFNLIKSKLKQAVIFDGRNLYEPQRMAQLGFTYYAIGRRLVSPI
ncbi:nucleotide sugar dehydrogenase [Candidatus Halobeggiatoa sp. HSG11]|nr:nucleotide sugar dehydrogenase [Candidatus Halobeggiatoa sp. HSG11]